MSGTTEGTTIILPADVDDPDGWGVKWALEHAGIDRDVAPALAEAIESQWWDLYADAAVEALEAAGYHIVRVGSMYGADYDTACRENADQLWEGDDGYPVDMVAVAHVAEGRFSEWWGVNAETLVEQHRPDWSLFDADTAERIGDATDAQVAASLAAKPDGGILIDADGDVVIDGTWPAQQPGVRRVYVA